MTPIWTIDGYFFRPRNMPYSHTVQQWAGNYPFQSSGLIENWSGQLKHWLSKTGGDRIMTVWGLACTSF